MKKILFVITKRNCPPVGNTNERKYNVSHRANVKKNTSPKKRITIQGRKVATI